MSSTIRLGLIGTGGISCGAHIPAWNNVQGVEVVAIAEPMEDRRAYALKLLGDANAQRVRVFSHYEDLLSQCDVELVDITMQPGEEKDRAIRAALEAGVHITSQKPLSPSMEAVEGFVRLAAEKKLIFSINQQARYAEMFAKAREWIKDGRLGNLRTIQLTADFPNAGASEWLNYSIHSFDLVRFWAGREPKKALAWHTRQTEEDHYQWSVWLDFGDGLIAQIWDEMASTTTLRWAFRIMGDGGTARGHERFLPTMFPPEIIYTPAQTNKEVVEPGTESYVPGAFQRYFQTLVTAIRGDGPVPTPIADNLLTLKLAHAAYASSKSGRWTEVETD